MILAVIKMIVLNLRAACLSLLISCLLPSIGFANDILSGWNQQVDKQKHTTLFQPKYADAETDILVKYYPSVLLEGQGVDVWLRNKLSNSKAPKGKWQGEAEVIRNTANIARGHRNFTKPDGSTGVLQAQAFSADRQFVRLSVIIFTENDKNKAYMLQALQIAMDIIAIEMEDALTEERGHDIEISPPKLKGLKAGGPIKPGRYVGSGTKGNETRGHYEIILYENGEYEFLNSKKDPGRYVYSQSTGKLNIAGDFYNSSIYPKREYCVYGIHRKTGKQTIYARDDDIRYRLTWNNPPDRLSPSAREELEALEKKRAEQYKYVTNPGDGITPDKIEAILYTFHDYYSYGGMRRDEEAYLLMKDGRVMDRVPVAPDILDVAKSRSREADRWGWWKREGNQYSFAWEADKKNFVIPKGHQIIAKPIPAGTRLDGKWGNTSTYSSLDFSSTSFWGVILDKSGRFTKYHSNIMGGGGEITGGGGPLVTSISNDEGSATSIIGSNVGGGSSKKNNRSGSDRMGRYEFDGYNLTLTFDNGLVKRLLTFTTGDDFRTLWFEGGDLSRELTDK
jgi:hypothetical protein